MELNSQVATLQDEVKLLKGEIKAVLKEIRTAVLSQDNPFSVDTALPTPPRPARSAEREEEVVKVKHIAEVPDVESIGIPTFGAPVAAQPAIPAPAQPPAPIPPPAAAAQPPAPQAAPVQQPMPIPPPAAPAQPPAPSVTNIIRYPGPPGQQSTPAAFSQPAPGPGPALLASQTPVMDEGGATQLNSEGYSEAASPSPAATGDDAAGDEYEDAPAAAERPARQRQPARTRQPEGNDQPAWTLSSVAGLAVWAEEALETLGPRRYRFVLKLAAFADLLPDEARELLTELDDSGEDDPGDDVPVSVNDCLVVLRQLDAIVHGERVIRLPRRRGSRLRRVR